MGIGQRSQGHVGVVGSERHCPRRADGVPERAGRLGVEL